MGEVSTGAPLGAQVFAWQCLTLRVAACTADDLHRAYTSTTRILKYRLCNVLAWVGDKMALVWDMSPFLCFALDQTSCASELCPAHRCMALLLYHGSAVGVHVLAACLLWRQAAAFRHERAKCLTLVVAFVIMMVRCCVDLGK